jgi:hypothetical protein
MFSQEWSLCSCKVVNQLGACQAHNHAMQASACCRQIIKHGLTLQVRIILIDEKYSWKNCHKIIS